MTAILLVLVFVNIGIPILMWSDVALRPLLLAVMLFGLGVLAFA